MEKEIAVDNRQNGVPGWLEVGSWRLEVGGWKLEVQGMRNLMPVMPTVHLD